MTTAARSPSAAAPPSRWTPGRRRAAKILGAILILALVGWGVFSYLLFNPFAGRIERLDRVIPASVAWAVRGSLDGVLGSPFVKERILGQAGVESLLRTADVEESLRQIRDEQDRINARLPGFLGKFDLRRDFLGSETAIFGSEDRVAVATRLSNRGRIPLSLLKWAWARRRLEAEGGPKVTSFPLIYQIDLSSRVSDPAWSTVWAALVKDVFIAGNDQKLVQDAAHLAATGGGGSLPDLANTGNAFSADSPAPVRGWIDLTGLPGVRAAAGALEGPAAFAAMILDPDSLSSAQAAARFPSKDEAVLEVSGVRSDAVAGFAGALAERPPRPAADMLKEAALLAPAGSTVVAARVEARAGAILKAAFGRFEVAIRQEVEKELASRKTNLDEIGRDVDDYLEPGVSVVIERLPECDALPLNTMGADPSGVFVLPVPGVLFVLRQKGSAGEGAAEKFFRRWMEEWKEQLESYEDLKDLPAGMTGFRFRPKLLTADKALWRPVAAFEGDLVLLSLNEGTLRRALEARAGKRPALADFPGFAEAAGRCGDGQVAAFIEMGAALKMRRDERREWATRRVEKDWVAERKKVTASVAMALANRQQQIAMKDMEEEIERQMADLERIQKEVEFPRALEDFERTVEVFDQLRSVAAGVEWDSAGFRLVLSVDTGR